MKAGIFDSGVGGLSVAKEIIKNRLFDEIIYFGDTARVPYGNKNESTIIKYSLDALEFLKNFEIDFLITACNSVSSCAIPTLQKEAQNIKIVGVIEAGIEAIKKNITKDKTILIIGTRATISSNIYQTLLKNSGYKNIISIATPLFVPFVEEGIFDGPLIEDSFDLYFRDIDRSKIDAVVLGCTHFPLISDALSRYFYNAKLIHSGDAIVELLKRKYDLSAKEETKVKFFVSDNPENLKNIANRWLNDISFKI